MCRISSRSKLASSGANTASKSALGIAADGRVVRGSKVMSMRLLRPENKLTLENLLTPVRKVERDVRVAILNGRVQAAQIIAVGPGDFWHLQRVENGLVVLVN